MHDYSHLWLFFVLVLSVVIQPGMDMAYVLGCTLAGGLRNGFMAIAGIVTGAACHTVMGTLGVGLILKLSPVAFDGVLLAGNLYLAWIGLSLFRSARAFQLAEQSAAHRPFTAYRRGALTNLLNPKAYLFTLAVYPQFLRPEYGPLALQAICMWVIAAGIEFGVYGSLVMVAGQVRDALSSKPMAVIMMNRGIGVVLMLGAALGALTGWEHLGR
ncbi:MAG TPA: LysE family translocator [Gammaproteobacteria bacterium]|nr:LysE family translocator [Gammaproteobacteria bacterium]